METNLDESTSTQQQGPSCSTNGATSDAVNFECNICLDLAQDPIVTLCGHLYCWPCLYKWLQVHSQSHECPVCKAIVEEEKLVPLYGRGKSATDPRSKPVPGVPRRPAGQRPQTAQPADPNAHPQQGFEFVAGVPPMATMRMGNFSLSAGVGGLFPSLFNFHMHGFPYAAAYGSTGGIPHAFHNSFDSGPMHGFPQQNALGQQANPRMASMFLFMGALIILALFMM